MANQNQKPQTLSPIWHKILNKSTLSLSGIGLLADILGIGKLVYDVVILGNLADLGFKLIILFIVFVFGVGLGVVAIRGFGNISVIQMGKFYAWIYIFLTCASYLGIAATISNNNYDIETYTAFIIVIAVQLISIKALQIVLEGSINIKQFSIPILTICLIHAILIVYSYVFNNIKVSIYIAGDLIFFTAMSLVGSAMLGDIGFKTMILKILKEIKQS